MSYCQRWRGRTSRWIWSGGKHWLSWLPRRGFFTLGTYVHKVFAEVCTRSLPRLRFRRDHRFQQHSQLAACLKPAVGATRRQFFMALEATVCISDPMCRLYPTKPLADIQAGEIREVVLCKRQDSPPRKVRRGKTEYTMDTSKIGRRNMTTPTIAPLWLHRGAPVSDFS